MGTNKKEGEIRFRKLTDSEGGNKKLYGNKKEGEIRFRKLTDSEGGNKK